MEKTLDEIGEEIQRRSKEIQDKRWKDNQLNRMELTLDRIENIVKAIGWVGSVGLMTFFIFEYNFHF